MNETIIAHRDPTEKDNITALLWWNIETNRFFIIKNIEDGKPTWEHLKEKECEI